MLKIGLLGYGTVGRSLAKLLAERDAGIELVHILRRPGKAGGPLMTDRFEDILDDPAIDVIVDVLSGTEPSGEYMRRAMAAGKGVVTANKAALALHYEELTALARERNVPFLFEASVGGGIPWIENLKKAVRVDRVDRMSGILNGTGNYIIDRMERFGMEFDQALAEAQAKGYAEADPTADIGGYDVANKAIISASVAMGSPVHAAFPVLGIGRISKAFLDDLRRSGRTLRHMMLFRRSTMPWASSPWCCRSDPLKPTCATTSTARRFRATSWANSSSTARERAAGPPRMPCSRTSPPSEHGWSKRSASPFRSATTLRS